MFMSCLLGTLLVNNVVASCFSNVKDHNMIQFYMSPFRWYYRMSRSLFIDKPFGDQTIDGIHIVPQTLYELVQWSYPSMLRLT